MKHTKKLSIIYALFFTLICTGIHAQKFDVDEFHIPEGLNLSDSEYKRLNNTGKQLREKLVAELQAQSYDVISPRRSKIRLERVGIEDIKIDYDPEADRVIFGKLLTVSNYITIKAYLYGSENGIRTSHEPLLITTINRQSHELNDPEEINIAVKEIIAGLSLDRSDGEEESSKRTEELEQERQEELARQEELKRKEKEELARQLELKRKEKEELAQQAELKQKEKEELAQQAESKRKEQKAIDKSTKVCSKAPGVTLILAGGLMGGAGVYLRSKAKKIYDEEYVPIYEEDPNARDKLDEARKPNRMAHIIGAGGILTAGLGAYLWAKCAKKQKNSTGIGNIQFTPHLEYNTMTNTNNVTARISFNF